MKYLIYAFIAMIFTVIWNAISNAKHKDDKATILRREADDRHSVGTSVSEHEPQPQSQPKEQTYRSSESILQEFLNENSCQHEFAETETAGVKVCVFTFNGGHFRAYVNTESNEILLDYSHFISVPTAEADRLLRAANDINNRIKFFSLTVIPNEKDNTAGMTLLYEAMHITKEDINYFVYTAPDIANYVRSSLQEKFNYQEWLEHQFDHRREYYLWREAELHHQDTQLISNPEKPLTVGSLINQLFDAEDGVRVEQMQYTVGGKTMRLKDAEQIFNFDIIPTVYDIERQKLMHGTVLQVRTPQYQYVFHLNAVSQSEFTVYIRLTAMQIEADNEGKADKLPTNRPDCISLLVAYDKTTTKNQHSEFEYMWLDAQDKIKQGKQSELTDEQKIIVNLDNDDIAEKIYCGNKYFLAGRYYEAIATLTDTYERMRRDIFTLSDKLKDAFYQICYIIGFSYSELHQYQRAYYYLEMAQWDSSINHLMEYINALTNGADVRVFSEIDRMMDQVKQKIQETEDGEPNEDLQHFYEFLLRRRGYACIEFHDLDTAERIFKDLLKYPDSKDYAQSELNYIQGLRKLQNTQETVE